MDWPALSIMLLTYGGDDARRSYADRTLRSTLDHLRYSGDVRVHIADDGSAPEHRQALYDLAGGYPHVRGITISDAQRGGYGRNYNLASQIVHIHAGVVLPLEDDWELVRDLNCDGLVEALQDPRIGCIRMGYLGFTRNEVRGRLVHVAGGTYFLIDADNEEPHIFAGHPRLELASWEREVGPWPERYVEADGAGAPTPGDTEFMVCHKPKARERIAWPTHLARTDGGDLFAHIGSVRSY